MCSSPGRVLDPATLGLYTTGLFLTQILVSKFVPASTTSPFHLCADAGQSQCRGGGFARSSRMVMLVAMPFYIGLAVTAEPLVATVLGPKWIAAGPLDAAARLGHALHDPAGSLQPGVQRDGASGARRAYRRGRRDIAAGLLPGRIALGRDRLGRFVVRRLSIYLAITAVWVLPVIGLSAIALARAIVPTVTAALAMGAMGCCLMTYCRRWRCRRGC